MIEGQDWAGYQGSAPSTKGIGFVFVKATEGRSFVNDRHDAQVAHARAASLVVGHYHFMRPGSPTAQASHFLAHAKPRPGDLLACDWEDAGVSCADKDAFIRAVQKAQPDLRTGLYANRDFWLHRDSTSFAGSFLWIADPSAPKGHPRVEHPWLFHQYSEAGGVDHNVGNFPDAADLRAWATGTPTPDVQEDTMATISDDDVRRIARQVVTGAAGMHAPDDRAVDWALSGWVQAIYQRVVAQGAAITALAQQLGTGRDVDTIVAAVQEAIAQATVHVQVDVTGPEQS
jgi:hypothetical protein